MITLEGRTSLYFISSWGNIYWKRSPSSACWETPRWSMKCPCSLIFCFHFLLVECLSHPDTFFISLTLTLSGPWFFQVGLKNWINFLIIISLLLNLETILGICTKCLNDHLGRLLGEEIWTLSREESICGLYQLLKPVRLPACLPTDGLKRQRISSSTRNHLNHMILASFKNLCSLEHTAPQQPRKPSCVKYFLPLLNTSKSDKTDSLEVVKPKIETVYEHNVCSQVCFTFTCMTVKMKSPAYLNIFS